MTPDFPMTRDIVLIGGGHCHALVLKMWAMAPLAGARLTLINPAPQAPYSGMLPGFIAGHYSAAEMHLDLVKLARAAGARFICSAATGLDRQERKITLRDHPDIGYDLCSIDIGITSDLPDIPGFEDHAIPVKPLGAFAQRWDQFCQAQGPADVAVLGGGVAGAEIAMAAAYRLRAQGRDGRIHLIDRARILSRLSEAARGRAMSAMRELGIECHEHSEIRAIVPGGVALTSGTEIASHITLGAAGTYAYPWLSQLGLAEDDGFLTVGPDLRSVTDPAIFAVGDCAHMQHAPRPKAGVFAVRQAPILFHNLKAAACEERLKPYHPQSDYLKLISLGERSALAEKRGAAVSGPLLWRWKDRIDRRFMRRLSGQKPMPAPRPPKRYAARDDVRQDVLCAGCGSKVGRGILEGAVAQPRAIKRSDITPLPGDDAALITMNGIRQVLSTDHLRAFTEDPVTLTRIAAIHALGDVWSMGATPQAMLINVTLPRLAPVLQDRTLREIMQTARSVAHAAGAEIIGGHTTMGAECTIGFTVTGIASQQPITLSGAQPADAVILTKPIGTGVLLAADMQMKATGAELMQAYASMSRPLERDADLLVRARASAMTDVTGFGLAGHLAGICKASGVGARLNAHAVPLLPGALRLSVQGVRSSLYPDNLSDSLPVMARPKTPLGDLMLDPQTAGGLLACVDPAQVPQLLSQLHSAGIAAAQIGEIHSSAGCLDLIE